MKTSFLRLSGIVLAAAVFACSPEKQPDDSQDPQPSEKPEPTVPEKVNLVTCLNLTPDFISEAGFAEGAKTFTPGDKVVFTVKPGGMLSAFASYHPEHIHVQVGDEVYMTTYPENAGESVEFLNYVITVPEQDFSVYVAYSVQQQLSQTGYTLSLEENEDGIKLIGVSPQAKYKYFDCYLLVPDAYTVNQVEYKMGSGEWTSVTESTGCGFERTALENVYNVSIRPDYQEVTADVTLRVKGRQHARYAITWVNATEKYVALQQFAFPTESIDGETVTAEIWTLEPYYLAGATSSVSSVSPEVLYRAYVRFQMPASDVTITLQFKEKIGVQYKASAHIAEAALYSEKDIYYGVPTDRVIPGEAVYLFANAEEGYKPSKAYNSKGEAFEFVLYGDGIDRYGYYAAVTASADATAETITADAVPVHFVSGENVYFEGGSAYAAGETVKFTVSVPAGKKVESVSAETASGSPVEVSFESPYGSFTMPDENVTVSVTYADTESGDTVHVSAYYDDEEYIVSSSTNYDWNFDAEGFDVAAGTNIYLSVYDQYGEPFWVAIQIGESVNYYEAEEDDMSGEYTFGRSFSATANVTIKVGPSKDSVAF